MWGNLIKWPYSWFYEFFYIYHLYSRSDGSACYGAIQRKRAQKWILNYAKNIHVHTYVKNFISYTVYMRFNAHLPGWNVHKDFMQIKILRKQLNIPDQIEIGSFTLSYLIYMYVAVRILTTTYQIHHVHWGMKNIQSGNA